MNRQTRHDLLKSSMNSVACILQDAIGHGLASYGQKHQRQVNASKQSGAAPSTIQAAALQDMFQTTGAAANLRGLKQIRPVIACSVYSAHSVGFKHDTSPGSNTSMYEAMLTRCGMAICGHEVFGARVGGI